MAVSFVPTQLSGCVLWLRADLGVTLDGSNNVSQWSDQSSSGNNYAQGTSGNRPAWNATGNARGTGPAIVFTNNNELLTRTSSPLGASTFTLFLVLKIASASGGTIADFGDTGGQGWGVDTNASKRNVTVNFATTDNLVADGAAQTTSWEEQTWGRDGTNWTLSVNGASQSLLASTSSPSVMNASSILGDRSFTAGTNPYAGRMDEVIGYSRRLSATEQAQVEAYIRARTAIW